MLSNKTQAKVGRVFGDTRAHMIRFFCIQALSLSRWSAGGIPTTWASLQGDVFSALVNSLDRQHSVSEPVSMRECRSASGRSLDRGCVAHRLEQVDIPGHQIAADGVGA
jgi:hypothetical protein